MSSKTPLRRRSLLALAAAATALALAAGPALAVFPHFTSTSTTLVFPHATDGLTARVAADAAGPSALPDLLFSFTLVGLGNVESTVEADIGSATAEFGCVNNGAKRPKASNKTAVTLPLSATGTFTPDRNGRIVGEILVDTAPLEDTLLTCPSGQTLTAISLLLEDLSLTELTTGATTSVPSVFVKLFG
jgi:hypothetical protein